jgi:hypothetical protein
MQGHQQAIQKMNQASQLCAQLEQVVRNVINSTAQNQYTTNSWQQGNQTNPFQNQNNPFQNQAQQFNQ